MQLTIHNIENFDTRDSALFVACIEKAKQYAETGDIHIYLAKRDRNGWLEYAMRVTFTDLANTSRATLYLGCIQRVAGGDCEFHS
jgi:hypothetical protein